MELQENTGDKVLGDLGDLADFSIILWCEFCVCVYVDMYYS